MKKISHVFAALVALAGLAVTTSAMALAPGHCEQCIFYNDGTVMCINCTF